MMPGWRRRSEPWAFCANVEGDDSQAALTAHLLSQFSHQSSELTQRVMAEVQDFLRVSLEGFAAHQWRLLQDALAGGLPRPRMDALLETPPHQAPPHQASELLMPASFASGLGAFPHCIRESTQASELFTRSNPASFLGAVPHCISESTEAPLADHKPKSRRPSTDTTSTRNRWPSFHPKSSRNRRPSTDTMSTTRSAAKKLTKHRTLKDLESSLNNMLIETQDTRTLEESSEFRQRGNDAGEVIPRGADSQGPQNSCSGVSRFMTLSRGASNAGPPHFNGVTPIDDGGSSAPTVTTVNSYDPYTSEGSRTVGLQVTASLRRAHERSLTAKLAEPGILLSADEPLAMEARSPMLSLFSIFFWLHLWGVLPWRLPGKGSGRLRAVAMHLNQLVVLLVATLTVIFRIGEVVLVSPEVHTVSNMLLAIGSFCCVLANWSAHRCNLFKDDQSFLLNYAKDQYFLRSWCWQSLCHLAEAILGWALTVASRAFLHSADGRLGAAGARGAVDVAAYSLTTGIFFASTFCQLHCMNALVCSVDRFSLRFTQDPSVPKRIQDWNSLQAMLRQASLAMEGCILVVVTTSMLMVFTCGVGSILDPSFGIVQSMLPVALLWATMGRVVLKSAHVTNRCNRVPSFVTALSAECEGTQLSERFLLVQFMESVAAGFYVSEIKLTSNAAMKLVYAGCMVMTTIFTAAVSGPSELALR